MNIKVNGKKQKVTFFEEEKPILSQVITNLGYDKISFAVALNENFVPRSAYHQAEIKEGDSLEIVAPMQGG